MTKIIIASQRMWFWLAIGFSAMALLIYIFNYVTLMPRIFLTLSDLAFICIVLGLVALWRAKNH